ncbi:MAG: hypothetical protein K2O14_09135, partial [Oscillospiraceae bacterium]|nr:hypothetical protein [Oscillospiraceae bacterium]
DELRGIWRGKRVNNGEWAFGCLVRSSNKTMIFVFDEKTNQMSGTEVDPSTLGECTGLHDKNGELVFEGDIVKCSRGCPHEVIYVIEHGGMFWGGMPAFYLSRIREGYAWMGREEIIGNIHDDPELLNNKQEV